jgi:hypothetical protein
LTNRWLPVGEGRRGRDKRGGSSSSSSRDKGWQRGSSRRSSGSSRRSSRRSSRYKGLGNRKGRKHFIRARCNFAQVWFVGEEVLVKNSRGTRGVMLRTAAKDMVSATTEHASLKTGWVDALIVGDRIDGARARGGTGGRLIAAHGLLSG